MLAYATVQGVKIPSLNEFLNGTLNSNRASESVAFDDTTDKILEAHALKTLQARQNQNGK